jgi:hypothetical protein
VKIFISSVRRNLEEERDALPGLIRALGHEPRRFEDYTAQTVPSRQACLDGVEDADAYLLLMGERYGDAVPDTGKSPTEEEFTVAKRRGIPILAYKKRNVAAEPAQRDFIERIDNYQTGLFRGSFANALELLPLVTADVRGLEARPHALSFEPLDRAVAAPWFTARPTGGRSLSAVLELHAVPVPPGRITATSIADLPKRLGRAGREHGLFSDDQALANTVDEGGAWSSARPDRDTKIAGLRVLADGTVTIWQEMPSDSLGVILDREDIASRFRTMVRLGAEVLPPTEHVALAVGLFNVWQVTEGSIADLGRRSSGTFPLRHEQPALVEPQDLVPADALRRGAPEISSELANRLIFRYRAVTR